LTEADDRLSLTVEGCQALSQEQQEGWSITGEFGIVGERIESLDNDSVIFGAVSTDTAS
jgi:hypothetical protein